MAERLGHLHLVADRLEAGSGSVLLEGAWEVRGERFRLRGTGPLRLRAEGEETSLLLPAQGRTPSFQARALSWSGEVRILCLSGTVLVQGEAFQLEAEELRADLSGRILRIAVEKDGSCGCRGWFGSGTPLDGSPGNHAGW